MYTPVSTPTYDASYKKLIKGNQENEKPCYLRLFRAGLHGQ